MLLIKPAGDHLLQLHFADDNAIMHLAKRCGERNNFCIKFRFVCLFVSTKDGQFSSKNCAELTSPSLLSYVLLHTHIMRPIIRDGTCFSAQTLHRQRIRKIFRGIPRAGLFIVPVVPWEGAPPPGAPADQLANFYHVVLTFECSVYA